MSNTTQTPNVKPVIVTETETAESEVKPNFVQKTKLFVKNHKKSTIAVGALVGLVGLAAVTGKKEQTPGFSATLEIEPPHVSFDTEVLDQETDTESA